MSIKTMALGVAVAAAAFAAPAGAQIWKRGDVVVRQDERVVTRTDSRVHDGARCVQVQLERYGSRRTETVCDWDRDGVYGDDGDRRVYEERRRAGRRDPGYGYWDYEYKNAGQRRKAEVHQRNEARKRDQERERREREILRERQKREQDALKERQKREREAQKRRQHRD